MTADRSGGPGKQGSGGERTSATPGARLVEGLPQVERLIVQLAGAIHVRGMYPPEHPQVGAAVSRLLEALTATLEARRRESITLLLVGDDLVVDQQPLRRGGLYLEGFVQTLRRLGVEGLTFSRGLTAAECQEFLAAMAAGKMPSSTEHLVVGRVKIAFGEDGEEEKGTGGEGRPVDLPRGPEIPQLEEAREVFARLRVDRRTTLGLLERLVWNLLDTLTRSTQAILPLAAVREHDEELFRHSVQVSLLVLAQGRSLGISDRDLHELGVAALLHDIGKLLLPAELLHKPGPLEGEDWELMRRHPELGAAHLCAQEGASPLAILVAYEHHLRYDGKPSYPLLQHPRRPALASQLTAVADAYDNFRRARPEPREASRKAALSLLIERAGTYLDPVLVENFCQLVQAAPGGQR